MTESPEATTTASKDNRAEKKTEKDEDIRSKTTTGSGKSGEKAKKKRDVSEAKLNRLRDQNRKEAEKIQQPPRRKFTPYTFNGLEPYLDLASAEFVHNVEAEDKRRKEVRREEKQTKERERAEEGTAKTKDNKADVKGTGKKPQKKERKQKGARDEQKQEELERERQKKEQKEKDEQQKTKKTSRCIVM